MQVTRSTGQTMAEDYYGRPRVNIYRCRANVIKMYNEVILNIFLITNRETEGNLWYLDIEFTSMNKHMMG